MSVLSDLENLAVLSPQQVLLEDADQKISASVLLASSKAVASVLQDSGVERGANIAILLPRGISAVIAVYAVLFADACYVPVDMTSPEARAAFVVRDAQCRYLIGAGPPPLWIEALDVQYLEINTSLLVTCDRLRVGRYRPDRLAAILYTSGSTGYPKGIAIPHRAIEAFAHWGRETFSLRSNDRIASLAPFHFDLSLFDLFTGPGAGATTVFIPDRLKLAPGKLVDWLIQQQITTWYTVPSILGFLALKGGLEGKVLPHLKRILFAGEVFPVAKLNQLIRYLPETRLYNLFGPTETNVCLYWPVQPDRVCDQQPIPIGVSACAAEHKIDDQTGELFVKGPCLMAGYWSGGQVTLPVDEDGWFHTGDRVSFNTCHEYEYHGRLDRMIKSAGYRVEPAEIEAVLSAAPGVLSAVVLGLSDQISGTRIVAVITGTGLSQQALRKYVSGKLPAYMQPARYHFLDKIPELSNGKADYQAIMRLFQEKK